MTAKIKVITGTVFKEAVANVAEVSLKTKQYRFENAVNLEMFMYTNKSLIRIYF